MGCGHSKISIYPKKVRNKSNCKKTATTEKAESEEEEGVENESELSEKLEDCDQRKTIRVKPFGGPLLAQTEISTSQQNFFKMLDEKIENGPDYDSASDTEKAAEAARLNALLKDWEIASVGSRSLPATPKRRARPQERDTAVRSADVARAQTERMYSSQISQSMIHQNYGITPQQQQQQQQLQQQQQHYRFTTTTFIPPNIYPPPIEYQTLNPMYTSQTTYQPPPRHYYQPYNNHQEPTYPTKPPYPPTNGSPKHINYSNGELIQQQIYNHRLQYQQAREYQQYRQTREQMLVQQQGGSGSGYVSGGGGGGYGRNYQSTVHIPIVVQSDQVLVNRKQYEPT